METYNHIFFVGIKGAAMANLARIFQEMGKKVSGSDVEEAFITDQGLTDNNITIIHSFEGSQLPTDVDLVVYSAAHGGIKNRQVIAAQAKSIKVMHQAEVLGKLIHEFKQSIAVAGCHGKTTTSSLLSYALQQLQVNPSYMVGVSAFNNMPGGAFASKDYFVVEADEYGMNPPQDITPKFHYLQPTHALITNIDFDHPDVYRDIEDTKSAFVKFMKSIIHLEENERRIIACNDDEDIDDILDIITVPVLTYGRNKDADIQVVSIQGEGSVTKFKLLFKSFGEYSGSTYPFEIKLPGDKNVLNATGVIGMLMLLGFKPEDIANAIKGFTGAKRRFELKKQVGETYLFDDYGHHPEEITATIQAAKMRFPDKRIMVIFQPHTFSRTERLKQEFIDSLAHADKVFLLPVFASAREQKQDNATDSSTLSEIAKKQGILFINSYRSSTELLTALKGEVKPGDIIFTIGAGDVYKLDKEIGKIISAKI